jgi:Uma2 family endonuclease
MTLALSNPPARDRLLNEQHLVMREVSWAYYEHTLEELAERPLRITYSHGSLEIMPPLPEHELPKRAISRLLEAMADELNIPMTAFGSTTFRSEGASAGLEPDECYYLRNADRVRGITRFSSTAHPPPDLAIEIDITARSIPRQPIYAALKVSELWRFDGFALTVLTLDGAGAYQKVERSVAFPFLPIDLFTQYVRRMANEEQTTVVREFRQWLRTLAPSE